MLPTAFVNMAHHWESELRFRLGGADGIDLQIHFISNSDEKFSECHVKKIIKIISINILSLLRIGEQYSRYKAHAFKYLNTNIFI